MINNINSKLIYLPVISPYDLKFLPHCRTCMLNAARPVPDNCLEHLRRMHFIACDSGGYQIYTALAQGKKVAVGPLLRTNANDPDILTLGTMDQCAEYDRTKANLAMTIDYPVNFYDSDPVYYGKLFESRKATEDMLSVAPYLCPNTELAIVLQPRNPLEVDHSFCFMFTPKVGTYAYPVRARNEPEDALGNAFVLSFLHDVGVRSVHFLGSSAPSVIFILAQALGLGMFERVTFDSFTWKQQAHAGFKYFEPNTLSAIRVPPHTNLRRELAKYQGVFEKTLDRLNPSKWVLAEKWADAYNIMAIENFKDGVLSIAQEGKLERFLRQFPKYGHRKKHLLEALRLLEESATHGHDYVNKNWRDKL